MCHHFLHCCRQTMVSRDIQRLALDDLAGVYRHAFTAAYSCVQLFLIPRQQNDIVAPLRVKMRQPQADAAGATGYIDSFGHWEKPSAEAL